MHARTKTSLALGALALGVGFTIYKRRENPAWTPWSALLSSSRDKAVALEKVKITSVPTPHETAALDPGMSTDQVKQVNASLSNETDMHKLANHAVALSALGHDNSAAAVAAKTVAIGQAKAAGAKDADLHVKQVEAAAVPVTASPIATGYWGHGDWSRHGWGRHWREHELGYPASVEVIDPATGLPVVTGLDPRFARRGFERRGERRGFEHRGFGRDPRFAYDRFARDNRWRHHHHHEPWMAPAAPEVAAEEPNVPVDDPWHRRWLEEHQALLALQAQQQQGAPADADADSATDAAPDDATKTGWWGWGNFQ